MFEIIGGILLVVVIADLTAGIFHWLEDRYGNPDWQYSRSKFKKSVYKHIIGPNILHHKQPAAMTKGNYWERNNSTIILALIISALSYIIWPWCWPVWGGFLLLTQANEVHVWAHLPKNKVNPFIRFLQKIKVLQTPQHHKIHHTQPYSRNYCVMTSFLNPVLSIIFFWEILELIVWSLTGASPVKEREIF